MDFKGLTIGVPKEIMEGERRVAATPETVKKMTDQGAIVLIETNAGRGAFFNDEQYKASGAGLVNEVEELFAKSELILKVKEPQFSKTKNKHEIEMMKKNQCLVGFIHPASPSNHQMVKAIADKGIISLSLDCIPRISRSQSMDALTSMSTVAGYKAVLMAADNLHKFMPMITTAVGMIKPANVLVIGAGVAGLQAIATAKRLGAQVYAADIRHEACIHAQSLGVKVIDLHIPPELAMGRGGYAQKLPDEWLLKERQALNEAVSGADIVILSALVPGRVAPVIITDEMVRSMRPGSVIVDIAIDQGGNCEITQGGTVSCKHGVIINGIKNIPGMLPESSTWMFAHNIFNFICSLVKNGRIELDMNDEIITSSLITKDGKIVHAGTLDAMGLL